MNKKQQTIDTYNASAERMAEKFNIIGARVDDIKQAFEYIPKKSPRVLEISCGNGRDATEIFKYTTDYLGIDVSSEMIRLAQETYFEYATKFVIADMEDFLFPRNIDIVFSFASLLHTPKKKLQKVLQTIGGALSPGGIIFISLKYSETYQEITKTDEFGTRTYYHYTPEDILEIAGQEYGWHKIEYQDLRGQKWFTMILGK